MEYDLEKGLRDLGDGRELRDAALSIDDILASVHRQRAVRAASLGLVGVAATAAVALGGAAATQHVRRTAAPPATTSSSPATPSSPSTSSPTTTSVPAPAIPTAPSSTPDPTSTARTPLDDASTRFDGTGSIVSDTPNPDGPLTDGDYVGYLRSVDLAAGTVTVDIAIFYGGEAAEAYNGQLAEPDGEVIDNYVLVNGSTRERGIPVASTLTVHTWCLTGDPVAAVGQVSRDPVEWAAATADGDPDRCGDAPSSRQGSDLYWFDVRDGQVEQIVGQYVP